MKEIVESYSKNTDETDRFDLTFWQDQEPHLIFEAVQEMLMDYLLIRGANADESRLQRTVEYFHRA